jgi:hypothetical protein
LHTPDDGFEVFCTAKPDAARTECAGVAITNVVERALDELAHMSGAAGQVSDDGGYVEESMADFSMSTEPNKWWETAEGIVQGREEGSGCWQNACCVLEATGE